MSLTRRHLVAGALSASVGCGVRTIGEFYGLRFTSYFQRDSQEVAEALRRAKDVVLMELAEGRLIGVLRIEEPALFKVCVLDPHHRRQLPAQTPPRSPPAPFSLSACKQGCRDIGFARVFDQLDRGRSLQFAFDDAEGAAFLA